MKIQTRDYKNIPFNLQLNIDNFFFNMQGNLMEFFNQLFTESFSSSFVPSMKKFSNQSSFKLYINQKNYRRKQEIESTAAQQPFMGKKWLNASITKRITKTKKEKERKHYSHSENLSFHGRKIP